MTFLLIHLYPPPTSSCPCQIALWKVPDRVGLGGRATPLWNTHKNTHCQKQSFQSTTTTTLFSPSTFSIDHLALSSINLQNALFKLLINTLIDLQKCHHTLRQELLMVVSPQRFSSLQSGSDECQNECVDYSLPGKADGFWFEVSKWTSKVLIEGGKCKCSCYLLVWPKKPIKCVLEERFSIFLYFHRTRV